jgi:hypothetical protein
MCWDVMDMDTHGEYVVYADESGDPSMKSLSDKYSVFILAFCVFSKREYIEEVVKEMKNLKFSYWGHDLTILHSKKIRNQMDDFYFLQNRLLREKFMDDLTLAIHKSPFTIITSGIDKHLVEKQLDLYEFFLELCVQQTFQFLKEKGQNGKTTHIVIESRGSNDKDLWHSFQRILQRNNELQTEFPVKLVFADKKTNSIGLQLADLTAYPIGKFLLDPLKKGASFEVVEKKLFQFPDYQIVPDSLPAKQEATTEKQKTPDFSEV